MENLTSFTRTCLHSSQREFYLLYPYQFTFESRRILPPSPILVYIRVVENFTSFTKNQFTFESWRILPPLPIPVYIRVVENFTSFCIFVYIGVMRNFTSFTHTSLHSS
ncbi:hypothetical protein ACJMK2_011342, partial [Sinanodonta woodiana]